MDIRHFTLTTGSGRSRLRSCADAYWPHVGECGRGVSDPMTVKRNQDGGRVSATRDAM